MSTAPLLPRSDLIEVGLTDLEHDVPSLPALLVEVGAPRLRRLGVAVPPARSAAPEHRLYALLAQTDPDSAHSRYNTLIRRLVSYERAAACGS